MTDRLRIRQLTVHWKGYTSNDREHLFPTFEALSCFFLRAKLLYKDYLVRPSVLLFIFLLFVWSNKIHFGRVLDSLCFENKTKNSL